MSEIIIEIENCKGGCPFFEMRKPYSTDGFDFMADWYCKKSDRLIQRAVEWHEERKMKIPDWCKLKIN